MIKLYEAERQVYYFRSDPYWPDVKSLGEGGFSGDSFIYFSVKSCGFVCLLYVHSEAKDGQRGKVSYWTGVMSFWLSWLDSELPGSSCLYLLILELEKYPSMFGLLHRCWGFDLRSSSLLTGILFHSAVFQPLGVGFLELRCWFIFSALDVTSKDR